MKIAICGDVHWSKTSSIITGNGEKYTLRLENLINSLNWFEALSDAYSCRAEVFLGDFFDKPILDSQEITALKEIVWAPRKDRFFLVGNHDADTIDLRYNSTNILREYGQVISEPTDIATEYTDITLIPYIKSNEYIDIRNYISKSKWADKMVVFAHQDLAGINYGQYVSQAGFKVEDIESCCDLFIDGHLHNHMEIGDKVHLLGNLTGQNFTEDANKYKHMVYILDTETLEIQKFENPFAFNFYKVNINNKKDLSKLENISKNDILSITCSELNIEEVKKLTSNNISRVNINYSNTGDESIEDLLTVDHVKQFIEFVRTKLEPSDMLNSELLELGGNNEY